MIKTLANNPLLVLFLVAGIGFLVGELRIGSFGLGVAGVLFAGIAAGAIDARLELPEIVYQLGLALFVYTMGLSAGPTFWRSLRRVGLRWNVLVVTAVTIASGAVLAAALLLHLGGPRGAGLFTGVLTNTPALAAVLERLHAGTGPDAALPVVAYSLAYPISVIASLIGITLAQRFWRIDYHAEAAVSGLAVADEEIIRHTVEVTHPQRVAEVLKASGGRALLGRVQHAGHLSVAEPSLELDLGDRVSVVGSAEAVADVTALLGETSPSHLVDNRMTLDFRRIFVSNPALVGKTIGELDLPTRYGAMITRVRRGDADLLAEDSTILELSDRVRVVAPPERMKEISRYFGDSYKSLGEVDVASFSIGIALGLLLGLIKVPMPGGGHFALGFAGGPLVVGLVLGARRRTGRLIWQLPAGVNMSLRQVGLVLFLAGIGTRAGQAFASTMSSGGGWGMLAAATVLCTAFTTAVLVVGHRVMHLPMAITTGLLAGATTQPATLAFASEQADNELPEMAYAAVFPSAMLIKIVLAQVLLLLL